MWYVAAQNPTNPATLLDELPNIRLSTLVTFQAFYENVNIKFQLIKNILPQTENNKTFYPTHSKKRNKNRLRRIP